jgi:hypothetical protein
MSATMLRALAVLVLALAIPVQGFASVGAGICMALGHHGDAGAAHDHEAGGAPHVHDQDASAGDHHDDGGHCAPCVACCAAAVIAAFPAAVVPEPAVSLPIGAAPASFDGIAPDRLDRPPLAL